MPQARSQAATWAGRDGDRHSRARAGGRARCQRGCSQGRREMEGAEAQGSVGPGLRAAGRGGGGGGEAWLLLQESLEGEEKLQPSFRAITRETHLLSGAKLAGNPVRGRGPGPSQRQFWLRGRSRTARQGSPAPFPLQTDGTLHEPSHGKGEGAAWEG